MFKKLLSVLLVLSIASCAFAYSRTTDRVRTRGKEAGMMLDMQKFNLGTLNNVEDKKQYLSIIQLEKQRIQAYSLNQVYEDAYIFYRKKDYQRSYELAEAILAIDPQHVQARTLSEQAYLMGAYGTLSESEIISGKMEEGKRLYNAGRLVEAQRKFEEILTIQPYNSQASSWVSKIEKEIANEHERRGDVAYRKGDYVTALDQWYSALLIRKDDSALLSKISTAETEYRNMQVKEAMTEAMTYYSEGKYITAYNSFQKVLKIQPGEAKATKYSLQLREEIANGYITSGNKALSTGKYDNAIANYAESKKWGYSTSKADGLIASARRARDKAVAAGTYKSTTTIGAAGTSSSAASTATKTEITTTTITHSPDYPIDDPRGIIEKQTTTQTVTNTAKDYNTELPSSASTRVTAEQAQLSRERYRRGLIAYNEEDFETARKECAYAKQLDPGNSDADACLRKIEEIVGK